MESKRNATKELVILIHGTFAASESNEGENWWQLNSPFYNKLKAMLGDNYEIYSIDDGPFHWNGSNTMAARYNAGQELASILLKLEAKNIKYHLVGHSHGGSVIWSALSRSLFIKKSISSAFTLTKPYKLQCLKSWITIGTPFLNVKDPIRLEKKFKYRAIIYNLIFYLYPFIGIFYILRLGFNIYFFVPLMLIFILVIFPILGLSNNCQIFHRELVGNRIAESYYSSNWKGMISAKDEAYKALKTANELKFKKIPYVEDNEDSTYGFDYITNVYLNILKRIVYIPKEKFQRKVITKWIKRNALGIDRSFLNEPLLVEQTPFTDKKILVDELPEQIESELYNVSKGYIISNLDKVWDSLYSIEGFDQISLIKNDLYLSGEELIHTNYFSNSYVITEISNSILDTKISDNEVPNKGVC